MKMNGNQDEVVSPEEILQFWFGAPVETEADALERARRWFMGGEKLDPEVRARFLPTVEAALRGDLDAWAKTIRGRLALIIVLDQLTRHAYRGDPKTWSGDPRARALCIEALDLGLDTELSWVERAFFRMPLSHAEDHALVVRAVACARRDLAEAPAHFARFAAGGLEQAEKYERIIARFGRFPFRNAVLGRTTTPEEAAFLSEFAGPPRVMRETSP